MPWRIKKVNELIKRELGKIILKEFNFQKGALVTLTKVKTSIDLGTVKVYISVIPEDKKKEITKKLEDNIWGIQQILNKKLTIRKVPKIVFLEDEGSEKAEKIREVLERIKND